MAIGESGSSVKLKSMIPAARAQDAQQAAPDHPQAEIAAILANGKFGIEPAVPNQLDSFPDTCRPGVKIFKVFDVLKPAELDAMNDLMAKTQLPGPGAPYVHVIKSTEYHSPTTGGLLVSLWYQQIFYMQLDKKHFISLMPPPVEPKQ